MKIQYPFDSNHLIQLARQIPAEIRKGGEFRFLREGGKRARYEEVPRADDYFPLLKEGEEGQLEFGHRKGKFRPWEAFEALNSTGAPEQVPEPKEQDPKPKEDPEATAAAPAPGFVQYLRQLNAQTFPAGPLKGYSIYSVREVAQLVLLKWPEKNAKSIKRVANNIVQQGNRKGRPINAWKPGFHKKPDLSTYIDELLDSERLEVREMVDRLSAEYGITEAQASSRLEARRKIRQQLESIKP